MTYREAAEQASLELGYTKEEARAQAERTDRRCAGTAWVAASYRTIPAGLERKYIDDIKRGMATGMTEFLPRPWVIEAALKSIKSGN